MTARTPPTDAARAATRATAAAFVGAGFVFASWASRIPAVRVRLDLTPSQLGLVLLAIAAGSVSSLLLSGAIVAQLGSRRTVTLMAGLLAVGMLVVAVGYVAGVAVLVAGLFVFGFAVGAWDMAMNVQAALVEQATGRPIMSRFHAGYSVGTVAGALLGAGAAGLHVSVTAHLVAVAVVATAVTARAVQAFLADDAAAAADVVDPAAAQAPVRSRAAWRERRTLLVGGFVLAFAFAEGTANDWITVAAIDGHDASPALAGVVYAVFLAAMTGARWTGPALLERHGRVAVVRGQALLGIAGVLVFVHGPSTATALLGALMWGAGVSLGFPVGMSAGADEPRHAPARVGVISSIGYCAFLAGPPLVGLLGDRVTTLGALTSVAVLLVLSVALAPATAPPARRDGQARTFRAASTTS